MKEDRRGVAVSAGDSTSLEIYETALRAFNIYRGDPVAIIDEALAAAPDFVMARYSAPICMSACGRKARWRKLKPGSAVSRRWRPTETPASAPIRRR